MLKFLFPVLPFIIIAMQSCGQTNGNKIKYLPLGDSYTICQGAKQAESWPVLLTKHLCDSGIQTTMLTNLARTGYTTQDLIDNELEQLTQNPDLVTLCIGVNDWVQNIDSGIFHTNLIYILNEIEKHISNKQNIILLTIPDFSVTPQGKKYSFGRDITKGITEFNSIIISETKKRNLIYIDLFQPSLKMAADNSLIAADGLHPSAKEYAIWEQLILPKAITLMKK
jgi:lysophospholipase L1-like esterase